MRPVERLLEGAAVPGPLAIENPVQSALSQ